MTHALQVGRTAPRDYHRRVFRHEAIAVSLCALAGACGGDPGAAAAGAADAPTFARDIAPLVYAACTPCHRPGGPTPFSLLGYDDVQRRRKKIVEVTGLRLMPPWLPATHGFVGDRRLTDAQVDLLRRWAEAGAPRGDAAAEPKCPEFPSEWQLRAPDLVVEADRAVTMAAAGPDVIRNLVLPVAIQGRRFVEAVEIRPESPAVHHAVLLVDERRGTRALDARDADPGFPGMATGSAVPPDGQFLGWTPGKRVRACKPGMAWSLVPGADLVLQLHLAPTGREELVRPRIGLWFTEVPPAVVTYPLVLFSDAIDIPPGERDFVVRDDFELPVPVTVHSVYPHAHYLARRMLVTATPPGEPLRELLRIDRWDFDWQDDYALQEPLPLPAGTRLAMEYHYDNGADNAANPSRPPVRVRAGNESTDEMATFALQVTVVDVAARRRLGEAAIRSALAKIGHDRDKELELAALLRDERRFDEALALAAAVRARDAADAGAAFEAGACLEGLGRAADAERAYRDCLGLDAGHDRARVQLGNVLLATGRAADAIPFYEAALAHDPQSAPVHVNLGIAYVATQHLDLAEPHLRAAAAADASLFAAWFYLGQVLAATGRPAEARDALQKAAALRPDDARVQAALARLPG